MSMVLPPFWLIRVAVAAVWLYEGLWCKLLGGEPHQLEVVEAVPRFGPRVGALFLQLLGVVEVAVALWALSGDRAGPRARRSQTRAARRAQRQRPLCRAAHHSRSGRHGGEELRLPGARVGLRRRAGLA